MPNFKEKKLNEFNKIFNVCDEDDNIIVQRESVNIFISQALDEQREEILNELEAKHYKIKSY